MYNYLGLNKINISGLKELVEKLIGALDFVDFRKVNKLLCIEPNLKTFFLLYLVLFSKIEIQFGVVPQILIHNFNIKILADIIKFESITESLSECNRLLAFGFTPRKALKHLYEEIRNAKELTTLDLSNISKSSFFESSLFFYIIPPLKLNMQITNINFSIDHN